MVKLTTLTWERQRHQPDRQWLSLDMALPNSGRYLGLVRWPSQLYRGGRNEGNKKARELRMTGPENCRQVKFPGPEARRTSDQTRD